MSKTIYNFGKAIKYYRTQKNISQRYLADKSGVSRSMIGMLEQGRRKALSVESCVYISRVFDISCDEMIKTALFFGEDGRNSLSEWNQKI